jgi:DNA-binding Lrp family transcriptional regulator
MRGNKRERILRVLLNNEVLSKNEISKKANCSRQWVILFLKNLEKLNLIKETKIINKKNLLKYWISISKKPNKYKLYMVKDPLNILEKTNLEYALTTYQAENIVQKFLFPSRFDFYIKKEDENKWHKLLLEEGLYGKGNVKVIIQDEHIMYNKRKLNELSIVSIPQLIVDLYNESGPCREASEMLMEKL